MRKHIIAVILLLLLSVCTACAGDSGGQVLQITECHGFTQGEPLEKENMLYFTPRRGGKYDLGGLSGPDGLEIRVTKAKYGEVSFRTNVYLSPTGKTSDCAKQFTVHEGETIRLTDTGLCDAWSYYVFTLMPGEINVYRITAGKPTA